MVPGEADDEFGVDIRYTRIEAGLFTLAGAFSFYILYISIDTIFQAGSGGEEPLNMLGMIPRAVFIISLSVYLFMFFVAALQGTIFWTKKDDRRKSFQRFPGLFLSGQMISRLLYISRTRTVSRVVELAVQRLSSNVSTSDEIQINQLTSRMVVETSFIFSLPFFVLFLAAIDTLIVSSDSVVEPLYEIFTLANSPENYSRYFQLVGLFSVLVASLDAVKREFEEQVANGPPDNAIQRIATSYTRLFLGTLIAAIGVLSEVFSSAIIAVLNIVQVTATDAFFSLILILIPLAVGFSVIPVIMSLFVGATLVVAWMILWAGIISPEIGLAAGPAFVSGLVVYIFISYAYLRHLRYISAESIQTKINKMTSSE